jgi:hypothetical protein
MPLGHAPILSYSGFEDYRKRFMTQLSIIFNSSYKTIPILPRGEKISAAELREILAMIENQKDNI